MWRAPADPPDELNDWIRLMHVGSGAIVFFTAVCLLSAPSRHANALPLPTTNDFVLCFFVYPLL